MNTIMERNQITLLKHCTVIILVRCLSSSIFCHFIPSLYYNLEAYVVLLTRYMYLIVCSYLILDYILHLNE